MAVLRPLLALGIPGLKSIVLIVLVAAALYGRGGSRLLMATRAGRGLSPWLNMVRLSPAVKARAGAWIGPSPPPAPKRHGRLFWALTLTAVAALTAWIATRVAVHHATGMP